MYDLLDMTCLPVDVILKLDGRFPIEGDRAEHILDVSWEPGGSGNIFVFFERLGGKTLPYAPIGDDIYGKWLKDTYDSLGIETKYLIPTEGFKTQVTTCIIDLDGVHTFASTLPSADIGDRDLGFLSDECRAFYLSGYSMAGDRELPMVRKCMEVVRDFHAKGKKLFFDPGPLIDRINRDVLEEILIKSDTVCFNHSEATAFSGKEKVEEAAEVIAQYCKGIVIVKDGARGCYVIAEDEKGKWYPGFKVEKVDTMGAGDCFFSAVMYGRLNGWDLYTMMTAANASGAAKTRKAGTGRRVPTFGEMIAVLEENGLKWLNEGSKVVIR
ncbi:MAG: carbohydrate kinase family protein [Erysipelotrichaceae bacterium]|nr:carbohydrate kinase family protein [Erysipelotrichaceae bacterium]